MTRKEFFFEAQGFDWFYEMSDDHRIWLNGHNRRTELMKEAKADEVKEAMWEAWARHMYSGAPWDTPKAPRPQLTDFDLGAE